MNLPKPPRSVWVCGRFVMYQKVDGWTRYDLRRPKRKPATRRRRSK